MGGAGLGPGGIVGLALTEGVGAAAKDIPAKARSKKNKHRTIRKNFFTKCNYTRSDSLLELEVRDIGTGEVLDENKN